MAYDIIVGRDLTDKKKFGDRGLIYLGRGYVKMGTYTSLSNKIYMDIARSHVVLVAGKRGCMIGDTPIFTDKGYKQIKDFNENEDKIFSFNKDTKDFEWEKAKLLHYPLENEDLNCIEFENGKKLLLTEEHPLLVASGDKLLSLFWVKSKDLKEGNKILSIGKSFDDLIPTAIKKISKVSGIKDVYDLTVPKNHSCKGH